MAIGAVSYKVLCVLLPFHSGVYLLEIGMFHSFHIVSHNNPFLVYNTIPPCKLPTFCILTKVAGSRRAVSNTRARLLLFSNFTLVCPHLKQTGLSRQSLMNISFLSYHQEWIIFEGNWNSHPILIFYTGNFAYISLARPQSLLFANSLERFITNAREAMLQWIMFGSRTLVWRAPNLN